MAYGNKYHKVMGYETHHLPHSNPKRQRNKNNNEQEIDVDNFELSFEFNAAHFIAFILAIYTIKFAIMPAILIAIFIVLSAGKIKTKK